MIANFLKSIYKTGKKAKQSVEDSMDFLDDLIEKEYITGSILKVKDGTGKIVEKAGTLYQKTVDSIDENLKPEKFRENVDQMIEKGKEMTSDFSERMLEDSDTIKSVIQEGKDFVGKLFNSEEE